MIMCAVFLDLLSEGCEIHEVDCETLYFLNYHYHIWLKVEAALK
jgi:hypothetical protein